MKTPGVASAHFGGWRVQGEMPLSESPGKPPALGNPLAGAASAWTGFGVPAAGRLAAARACLAGSRWFRKTGRNARMGERRVRGVAGQKGKGS